MICKSQFLKCNFCKCLIANIQKSNRQIRNISVLETAISLRLQVLSFFIFLTGYAPGLRYLFIPFFFCQPKAFTVLTYIFVSNENLFWYQSQSRSQTYFLFNFFFLYSSTCYLTWFWLYFIFPLSSFDAQRFFLHFFVAAIAKLR